MKPFQNILLVIEENEVPQNLLQAAKRLADQDVDKLTVLVLHPPFPENVSSLESQYREKITDDVTAHCRELGIAAANLVFETQTPYFVKIIRYALQNDHDLIVKNAEKTSGKNPRGLKSLDMELLRKSPVPVLLLRDDSSLARPRLLTAIDPLAETKEGQNLNLKLLRLGDLVANQTGSNNKVISCWRLEHENFLKGSAFSTMKEEDVQNLLEETEQKHRTTLEKTLAAADITPPPDVICKKGKAPDIIPDYVDDHEIDLLIMGTVARTGIEGFIIGNTAENILQSVTCSMLAVKPPGFISPVSAY